MAIRPMTMAASLGLGSLLLIGPAAPHTSAQAPKPKVTIFDGKTLVPLAANEFVLQTEPLAS
ncbi:MAG: hypothetical protein H0V80_06930 [Acidobacteria bacterium]|nr:hypothetical protein [Acidobacteriota bacterium]